VHARSDEKDGGTETQSLISVPNIIGLNPKSFHSEYDVKAYVSLILIRLLDRDVKPGGPFLVFNMFRQIPYLTFITHILHHDTTVTHTSIIDNSSYLQKMAYTLALSSVK
jgi:hypothetical protein